MLPANTSLLFGLGTLLRGLKCDISLLYRASFILSDIQRRKWSEGCKEEEGEGVGSDEDEEGGDADLPVSLC